MIALCLLMLGAGPPSDEPLPDGAVARLGSAHFRGEGVIHALAGTADGRWLAMLDDDGLWLMDAHTGRKVRRFMPFRPVPDRHRLSFSPDGKWLAVLPLGTVYSVPDCEAALTLELGDKQLASIAFSARGRRVAAGSERGKGRAALAGVWDLDRRRLIREVAFVQPEARVALSPDGESLAVWGGEWGGEMLRIWDVRKNRELVAAELDRLQPESGTFSPDGKLLALAEGNWGLWSGRIVTWETDTGKKRFEADFRRGWLAGLEWTPDGRSLFVATQDGHAEQFDPKGKRVGQWVPPPGLEHLGLVCTEKNEALALGRHMGSVRVWKVPGGEKLTPDFGHQGPVQAAAFSRDGRAVITASADGCITWAGGKGWPRRLAPLPSKDMPPGRVWVGLSPHGRYFAQHERGERLRLFDVAQGRELAPFERPSLAGRQLAAAAFPADESAIAVISAEFGRPERSRAQVFSMPERRLRRTRQIGPEFGEGSLAVSPDGSALAVCPALGEGLLYDLIEREERGTFSLHGPVRACFTPDGRLLALAGKGGVRLLDARTAREVRHLPVAGVAGALAVSPDGRLLAAAVRGREAGVMVWELASGTLRHWLRGQGGVGAVAFSPDAGCLAAGGFDSITLIWDMAGGGWVASLATPGAGDVEALAGPDAFAAMARLVGHPAGAVKLLSGVKPARGGIDGRAFRALVTGLGDEDAGIRRHSRERLEREAPAIAPRLDEALKEDHGRETLRILRDIRARADGWPGAGKMGEHRAVEVAERIGTKAAIALLRSWAKGSADAALTLEAKAALSRMEKAP